MPSPRQPLADHSRPQAVEVRVDDRHDDQREQRRGDQAADDGAGGPPAGCGALRPARIGSRSPKKLEAFSAEAGIAAGTFAEVAAWAEGVVLAVVGRAAEEALRLAGAASLSGKLVIDTTNPIAEEPPVDGVLRFFTGPNDSLMERLQAAFPAARFVKAFNSVGNAFMVNPSFPAGPPTMFY